MKLVKRGLSLFLKGLNWDTQKLKSLFYPRIYCVFCWICVGLPFSLGGELPQTSLVSLRGQDLMSGKKIQHLLTSSAKASIVVFLSARCPCSASHEISLKELFHFYSSLGFDFIGIHSNTDEEEAMTVNHFKKAQLPFPVIQDEHCAFANALGALKTPHVFMISPKNKILYQGGIDDCKKSEKSKKLYLKNALAAILKGELPEPSVTRTLGCVIQR